MNQASTVDRSILVSLVTPNRTAAGSRCLRPARATRRYPARHDKHVEDSHLEHLLGRVGARTQGRSPIAESSCDHRLLCSTRRQDLAVTDGGPHVDRLFEQGEGARRIVERVDRECCREGHEPIREDGRDARVAADAHGLLERGARAVGVGDVRRASVHERARTRGRRRRRFPGPARPTPARGGARHRDHRGRTPASPVPGTPPAADCRARLRPPPRSRRASAARSRSPPRDGAPGGPGGNDREQRMLRRVRDLHGGVGPVHRGVPDRHAVHREWCDESERVVG